MEALIIQMALEIRASVHQSIENFQGFDVCEILICRGDEPTNAPAFNGSFDIFVQQYKASLFDEADRETERITMPQGILDLFKEGDFGIICQELILRDKRLLVYGIM